MLNTMDLIAYCKKLFKRTTSNVDIHEARVGVLGHHALALLATAVDNLEELQSRCAKYKKIAEYARHKPDCGIRPDQNVCHCGLLQALKGE